MEYCNAPGEPGRPPRTTRQASRRTSAARRLTALYREERGQSLVLVVMSMTLIVLIAAVAIDVSQWFVKHHQAQVTADAAALAAANYMGHGGTSSTATTYATTYATDNGLPITGSNVTIDTSASTASVTVPTTGPLSFAGISLGSGPSISAHAVASWKIRDCSSASVSCAFAYAADNVCSGNTGVNDPGNNGPFNHGITLSKTGTGSGIAIYGDVISASMITASNNGNPTYNSTAIYPLTESTISCVNSNSPSTTQPKPFTAVVNRAVASQWPIDYSKIYSACSSTGSVKCDSNGYPSYCTPAVEGTSAVTTVTTNAIYCNAGSGASVNRADPSTWDGTINVTAGGAGVTIDATYIAGTVDFNLPTNTTVGPAGNNAMLVYAAACNSSILPPTWCNASPATSSPAIYLTSNGNATVSGDMFAPAGVIDSQLAGTPSITGFLEGWDVVYQANGTVTGQGPQNDASGYFVGDYLLQ